MDLKDLTPETFEPLVGDTFSARVDDESGLDLELLEVTRAKGEDRPDNAFSILFKGPIETFLQQRLYELDHAALGVLPIFLVPIAERDGGYLYEAVFTRLDDPSTP